MTAHRPKPTITPERVAWFAEYYKRNPAWGAFHVVLDDGNLDVTLAELEHPAHPWPEDVREAVRWFDSLTPSQRRRLGQKAESLANTTIRAS